MVATKQPRLNIFQITATIPDLETIVKILRKQAKATPAGAARDEILGVAQKYADIVVKLKDYKAKYIDKTERRTP